MRFAEQVQTGFGVYPGMSCRPAELDDWIARLLLFEFFDQGR
jgi:hypothetical protein